MEYVIKIFSCSLESIHPLTTHCCYSLANVIGPMPKSKIDLSFCYDVEQFLTPNQKFLNLDF
jgi:hypothetical protein